MQTVSEIKKRRAPFEESWVSSWSSSELLEENQMQSCAYGLARRAVLAS